MPLSEAQYNAVQHFKGPALILAGPGSGKTTVITNRVKNLIYNYNVLPRDILVITFTKMAALEMKNRFLGLGVVGGEAVTFGTFHSVFFTILKQSYNYKGEDIIKVSTQREFIKEQLGFYGINVRDEYTYISDILDEIAKVKGLEAANNYTPSSCDGKLFFAIYNEYNNMLRQLHLLDFEDMMLITYRLLIKDTSVLRIWQKKYRFFMIDEFQDASAIQYNIVKLLAKENRNIFIVGDDDQSIYGFRGAAPKVMKEFVNDYPDAKVFKLVMNYRSVKNIVESATALINHNKDRFYKELSCFNQKENTIEYVKFDNLEEECAFIANDLMNCSNAAVLTRTSAGALDIIDLCKKKGLRVNSGKKENIYNHWIVADLYSFFLIAIGSRERRHFLRVINKPSRYISRKFFIERKVNIEEIFIRMEQGGNNELIKCFKDFMADLKAVRYMNPYAAISYVRRIMRYDDYIRHLCIENNMDSHILTDIVEKVHLESLCFETLRQWIDMVDLKSNQDEKKSEDENGDIRFLTMHKSKGLEFDTVFIPDVNEEIVPYSKAVTDEDLEEERRLFYVAVTRAKRRLVICSVKNRYNKTMQISRFVEEMHG